MDYQKIDNESTLHSFKECCGAKYGVQWINDLMRTLGAQREGNTQIRRHIILMIAPWNLRWCLYRNSPQFWGLCTSGVSATFLWGKITWASLLLGSCCSNLALLAQRWFSALPRFPQDISSHSKRCMCKTQCMSGTVKWFNKVYIKAVQTLQNQTLRRSNHPLLYTDIHSHAPPCPRNPTGDIFTCTFSHAQFPSTYSDTVSFWAPTLSRYLPSAHKQWQLFSLS